MKVRLLLWVKDVKSLLGISTSTVNRMVAKGSLPPPDAKVNGRRVWRQETIETWISRGCPQNEI